MWCWVLDDVESVYKTPWRKLKLSAAAALSLIRHYRLHHTAEYSQVPGETIFPKMYWLTKDFQHYRRWRGVLCQPGRCFFTIVWLWTWQWGLKQPSGGCSSGLLTHLNNGSPVWVRKPWTLKAQLIYYRHQVAISKRNLQHHACREEYQRGGERGYFRQPQLPGQR